MAKNFKVVISDPKSKKAFQKEADQAQSGMLGKKIGEKVSGNGLGLDGYELELTGGSDIDGFPMRKDIEGTGRKKVILASGPGYNPKSRGKRKRKSIRGNTVSSETAQINVKVAKAGPKTIDSLLGKKDDKPAEAKAEKKEEPKSDEKAADSKADAGESKEDKKPAETKTDTKPDKPAEAKAEKKEEPKSDQSKDAEAKMGVKPIEEQEKKADSKDYKK